MVLPQKPENPVLSQTAEYALRTVLHLASRPPGSGPARVGELARILGIPQNYLSKTLHLLARDGILSSTRGKHGGFQLARPADRITLLDIVGPFDRMEQRRQCLLGRPTCSDLTPCAAHGRWRETAEKVASFFRETTVADLQD